MDLMIPSDRAAMLGLSGEVTYRQAREAVLRSTARRYVGAVLALVDDERVAGRDL